MTVPTSQQQVQHTEGTKEEKHRGTQRKQAWSRPHLPAAGFGPRVGSLCVRVAHDDDDIWFSHPRFCPPTCTCDRLPLDARGPPPVCECLLHVACVPQHIAALNEAGRVDLLRSVCRRVAAVAAASPSVVRDRVHTPTCLVLGDNPVLPSLASLSGCGHVVALPLSTGPVVGAVIRCVVVRGVVSSSFGDARRNSVLLVSGIAASNGCKVLVLPAFGEGDEAGLVRDTILPALNGCPADAVIFDPVLVSSTFGCWDGAAVMRVWKAVTMLQRGGALCRQTVLSTASSAAHVRPPPPLSLTHSPATVYGLGSAIVYGMVVASRRLHHFRALKTVQGVDMSTFFGKCYDETTVHPVQLCRDDGWGWRELSQPTPLARIQFGRPLNADVPVDREGGGAGAGVGAGAGAGTGDSDGEGSASGRTVLSGFEVDCADLNSSVAAAHGRNHGPETYCCDQCEGAAEALGLVLWVQFPTTHPTNSIGLKPFGSLADASCYRHACYWRRGTHPSACVFAAHSLGYQGVRLLPAQPAQQPRPRKRPRDKAPSVARLVLEGEVVVAWSRDTVPAEGEAYALPEELHVDGVGWKQ